MKQRFYFDLPLIAFTTVMLAAVSITSHGTYLFYSLFLDWRLAGAATIVLTGGIPLLELAAVLDQRNRTRYLIGMILLLAIEGLAQYLNAQAWFSGNVAKQFPNPVGIDLATFAAKPEGRILPILFLAALPFVVVYFGYAASIRIRDLRSEITLVEALRNDLANISQQLRSALTNVAEKDATITNISQQLCEQNAARIPMRSVILEYVRSQIEEGKRTLNAVAKELDISESTIRFWLTKATEETVNE